MKPELALSAARPSRSGIASAWRLLPASAFGDHLAGWETLTASRPPNPVIQAAFIHPLLRLFGTGRELLAIRGDARAPDAMAILAPKRARGWETFQPSQHPLSAWIHRPEFAYEDMMAELMALLPGMPLMLAITQKDPDIHPRPADTPRLRTLDYVKTVKIVVNRSFEGYWDAREHGLRRQFERRLKRLQSAGVTPQLDALTEPDAVGEAIAEFGRLESAGWKGRSGTAIHPGNLQGRLYEMLLREFCARGQGVIYRYRFDRTTVAMELCVEAGGTLVMLKTAYDESQRSHAPGMLMRREIFRRAFASGRIRKIEFLGALQPWQEKWCDDVRTLYHVNYYRWPWLAGAHRVSSALRRRSPGAASAVKARYAVSTHDTLSALPPAYERLFRKAAPVSMFHTLPWYRNFVQTVLGPHERLRIYAVEDAAKKPRAVLLMRHAARLPALGPRILAPLGNYYTSLFGPVFDPEDTQVPTILENLALAIGADSGRWDVVDLHPLALEDAAFASLESAFAKAGFLTGRYLCFGNWYLPVAGQSFAQYFEGRPSRLSKTAARQRRKLERTGRLRFQLYHSLEDLDLGLAAYDAVYRSSWKVPEPYPAFIPGLLRSYAEQGWLRLGVVYLDGQPAAAQIWMVVERTASIYKMAYDERYAKDSAGTVLSSYLMQHVLEVDKVETVDYLTGDDAYKRDWMSHRRERWGIVAFNARTPLGLLAAARHHAGRTLRGLVRNLKGKPAPGKQ